MNRSELAKEYFLKGFNCAQSVALAFSDLVSVDGETLASLASPFGGGMGRMREVCGALSGAFLIVGLLHGYDGPETGEIKKLLYERTQALGKQFEGKEGSMICRTLLNKAEGSDSPTPTPRDANFYQNRPCLRFVMESTQNLQDALAEWEKPQA